MKYEKKKTKNKNIIRISIVEHDFLKVLTINFNKYCFIRT